MQEILELAKITFVGIVSGPFSARRRYRHEVASEKWTQTQEKIRRLGDTGAFLFSRAAEAFLQRLRNEQFKFKPGDSPDGYYRFYASSSRRCLDELVAISKKDLRIGEKK